MAENNQDEWIMFISLSTHSNVGLGPVVQDGANVPTVQDGDEQASVGGGGRFGSRYLFILNLINLV